MHRKEARLWRREPRKIPACGGSGEVNPISTVAAPIVAAATVGYREASQDAGVTVQRAEVNQPGYPGIGLEFEHARWLRVQKKSPLGTGG
jgi:hypothetical protein